MVAALQLLAGRIQYCSWSHPVLKSDFSDNGYSYLSAAAALPGTFISPTVMFLSERGYFQQVLKSDSVLDMVL